MGGSHPGAPVVGAQFHGTWEMYWNGTAPNAMFTKHLDTLAAQGVQMIRTDVGWSSGQLTNVAPDANQWYHKPWLTFLARTYGAQLAAIEVWNEPNLAEFCGIADAHQRAVKYVPILQASYAAIKAGRASLPVIFAGPSQTDDGFIRDCYDLGVKGSFMPAIISLMAARGDGAKPIWWTEFGFSVHSNEGIPAGQVWLFGVPTATGTSTASG
ncbi:hypothetical protein [Cryptosporangium phraense]|uniref:Glycoside hydrolase family 5 domain-containing protein n=1 Tax=Cryptosporangium phraense TaxID=2593070 RepID=A0A545ARZ6_9ACTN|nr:hypothetical protein [Cryptosporangium phraense]TQS44021.1 hypothetical protein FL583_16335 [Cryptosporangium phraense]